MNIIKTLLLCLFSNMALAQDHVPVFPDLSGTSLLNSLRSNYKPATVLGYSEARDIMYSLIDNVNDSVACVYSGHKLFLPQNVDPSFSLYMDSSPNGINTEHTYPRSKGASEDNGNAFSDLHHLFPARAAVNTSRSNFPFGDIQDNQTTSWFYRNQVQSSIPTTNLNSYSERINGRFEPKEDHKGNVARAIFYFFTMYNQEALNADPNYFEGQRQTLCAWHDLDPVDLKEWNRTYSIAAYQNDLPNPYIVDCSLAYRSFCEEFTSSCPILSGTINQKEKNISIYPNPVTNLLKVETEGNARVQVFDVFGKLLIQHEFNNSTEIDFFSFSNGTYFIRINSEVFKIAKSF